VGLFQSYMKPWARTTTTTTTTTTIFIYQSHFIRNYGRDMRRYYRHESHNWHMVPIRPSYPYRLCINYYNNNWYNHYLRSNYYVYYYGVVTPYYGVVTPIGIMQSIHYVNWYCWNVTCRIPNYKVYNDYILLVIETYIKKYTSEEVRVRGL
jgi:hypothetical protein